MRFPEIPLLIFIVLGVTSANATDLRSTYVGQSRCASDFEGDTGSYGIRLDKTQIARLEARTVRKNKLLMIVQYNKEWDKCGTVRDVVEATDNETSFIFECVDDRVPGNVVVGTWKTPKISGRSLEAWRIDLRSLTFVRINDRLRFVPQHGPGNDDGRDLVDWARQRTKRSKAAAAQ